MQVITAITIQIVEGGGNLLGGEALLAGAAVGLLSSAIPYSMEV